MLNKASPFEELVPRSYAKREGQGDVYPYTNILVLRLLMLV